MLETFGFAALSFIYRTLIGETVVFLEPEAAFRGGILQCNPFLTVFWDVLGEKLNHANLRVMSFHVNGILFQFFTLKQEYRPKLCSCRLQLFVENSYCIFHTIRHTLKL